MTDKATAATGLREYVQQRLAEEPGYVVACLMAVYSCQTQDERQGEYTEHKNHIGFNATDAYILSEFAAQYHLRGYLSEKQVALAARKLTKYWQQVDPDMKPLPCPTKEEIQAQRRQAESKRAETNKGAKINGDRIEIRFPFDEALIAKVKALHGRRWNGAKKFWHAPLSVDNAEMVLALGLPVDPAVEEWLKAKTTTDVPQITECPGLAGTPYPFQWDGLSFIESRKGRALIGDEMGLGKTIQALMYLQLHPELRPAVVVCPASVKLNWAREIKRWMSEAQVEVISSSKAQALRSSEAIYVINYDILSKWQRGLAVINPKAVILDECHYVKNPKAKRTKAVKALTKKADHVIALSGTPIINRPIEIFTALAIIEPGVFPSFWSYAQRYCGARHNGFGWDFNGASNTDELHTKLTRTVMLRRLKKDVLKDLPPKVRSIVPLPIDNEQEYNKAESNFIGWLIEQGKEEKAEKAMSARALQQIEVLKQLTIAGKIAAVEGWIKDYLETNDKLVVFCTHRATVDELMSALKDYSPVKLDGSTAAKDRQAVVDRFQTDPKCRVFIGNIKAAGIGITLTAANATCFVELGWTPGEHDQAEDRVHRIGQEADSVMAYYLIADGTIEDEIAVLLDKKRAVLAEVLDGQEVEEESMLSALLNKLREEKQ